MQIKLKVGTLLNALRRKFDPVSPKKDAFVAQALCTLSS
jgi:hypothetical protein